MERYSILRVIGEGSFGRALLVRTRSSQEEHVLKEIRLPKVCCSIISQISASSLSSQIIVSRSETIKHKRVVYSPTQKIQHINA